ncbi:Bug1p ASCRUDRAFT_101257 [Ascoidea rubescens DSM 1968]|uniref:Uncharacterized protein n=1 Tax=Ascoidea rubescens DSM 1968 TaxID=1344418 RepID=A0A1D2VQX6_9ASCO|nr:hypothetical protein ASCRUDRAFT_101257 [Ascoidea rubescens DSM 1968]ODV63999.1 hypothetical protein ASCRUDRAFT_101257 [Ascoidea rubescens DSM 1968]
MSEASEKRLSVSADDEATKAERLEAAKKKFEELKKKNKKKKTKKVKKEKLKEPRENEDNDNSEVIQESSAIEPETKDSPAKDSPTKETADEGSEAEKPVKEQQASKPSLEEENITDLLFDKEEKNQEILNVKKENSILKFEKLDLQDQLETLSKKLKETERKLAFAKIDAAHDTDSDDDDDDEDDDEIYNNFNKNNPRSANSIKNKNYDPYENKLLNAPESQIPTHRKRQSIFQIEDFFGLSQNQTQNQNQNFASNSNEDQFYSYEELKTELLKWKNFSLDMREWRSIGTGPIIDC